MVYGRQKRKEKVERRGRWTQLDNLIQQTGKKKTLPGSNTVGMRKRKINWNTPLGKKMVVEERKDGRLRVLARNRKKKCVLKDVKKHVHTHYQIDRAGRKAMFFSISCFCFERDGREERADEKESSPTNRHRYTVFGSRIFCSWYTQSSML